MEGSITTNGNGKTEKKRFGRRAGTGAVVIFLTTAAFYICMFKGVPLEWFAEYVKLNLYVLGFIVGTLTITDSIMGWRK